jgi:hypothetical protein
MYVHVGIIPSLPGQLDDSCSIVSHEEQRFVRFGSTTALIALKRDFRSILRADVRGARWHVANAPISEVGRLLFDHLVRTCKQCWRYVYIKHLCGIDIDDELEFRRLLNW